MSFDGIVLQKICQELKKTISGARIFKIYQPQKQQVVFHLHQKGLTHKLLFSGLAQEARVHLVSETETNPSEPPLFCMVLRKQLMGGRLISIEQPGLERILKINCQVINELGEPCQRLLIMEIMGRHSNLILLDPAENRIIDALQRIPAALSRYRQILPGLTYQDPPPQKKLIPWQVEQACFYEKLLKQPEQSKLEHALLNTCAGLSPQSIREIIISSDLKPETTLEYCGEYELSKLWQTLIQLGRGLMNSTLKSEIILKASLPLAFSAFPLEASFPGENRKTFTSMSQALEFYYQRKNAFVQIRQKKTKLEKIINKEIAHNEKKLGRQLKTLESTQNAEQDQLWGELLTANLHALSGGKKAEVANYYHPKGKIEIIPLNPQLTPAENAQHYFKLYRKKLATFKQTKKQLAETKEELSYLYSLLTSLNNANQLNEIKEIEEEIRGAGYLKKGTIKRKETPSRPLKLSINGWLIYVGKNNRQNDLLTMKMAKKEDLWLHPQNIPGSHVLIKNREGKTIPREIIEKAALLAAYHSQARHSTQVPIDYTERKNVWKPKGAKPGFVLYEKQKTLYVTPEKEVIKALLQQENYK